MKKLALVAGVGLLVFGSIDTAEAQHRVRDGSSNPPLNSAPVPATTGPGIILSPSQLAIIKQVLRATHAAATAPVSGTNYPVILSDSLPESIPLKPLPPQTGLATYRFGIVNGKTMVVHPNSRKVVGIIQ